MTSTAMSARSSASGLRRTAQVSSPASLLARRPGHVVYDGALFTDQLVEEGGLADVGAPDDRDAQGTVVGVVDLFDLVVLTELVDDEVEQIARSTPVQRADRVRIARTQLQELPTGVLMVRVVDLVDDEHDRSAAAQGPSGGVGILVDESR